MSAKKFVDPFPLSTSQAAATPPPPTPAAPAHTVTRQPIDPHTNPAHDWYNVVYEEPIVDEAFAATVDAVVLTGDAYSVVSKLQSGTLRTDRREVSPYETALMNRDKYRREQNRYDIMGSSQTGDEAGPTSPLTKQEGKK